MIVMLSSMRVIMIISVPIMCIVVVMTSIMLAVTVFGAGLQLGGGGELLDNDLAERGAVTDDDFHDRGVGCDGGMVRTGCNFAMQVKYFTSITYHGYCRYYNLSKWHLWEYDQPNLFTEVGTY